MVAEKTIVTYWLCPAEPARNHFAMLICNLAEKFNAPFFEPHVTLYVTDAANENPSAVLEQVVKNRQSCHLSVRGLDHSDKFTKTVFVQFEPDEDLARLSSDLRRASTAQNDYQLNPHLSLIYKTMDRETKRDLAASLRLPFDKVRFDSAKAVISPAKIESRADVEAWRVVATHRITG
ncbi:MAG: hypothetical protein DME97_07270 [Verrucomicrobia bacterium]|nr:MAG: hypothetical protein DME97_07270 [Verrucomicrobiota bacterium]